LHWRVLAQHDGFWINVFQQLTERGKFTDPAQAEKLIAQGSRALQAHDMRLLRETTQQLWVLVPQAAQREAKRRASDAGIR
jgi:hypothetical protein